MSTNEVAVSEAANTIILADMNQVVHIMNKSSLAAGSGLWLTQTLNRDNPAHDFTLQRVTLRYTAEYDTLIKIWGSGDGGITFPVYADVPLEAAEFGTVTTWLDVTGFDLRLLFEIPEGGEGTLLHYTVTITDRGPSVFPRI